ncbi:WbqC family protein [Nitrincola alkalilacustris]|uniref:WbqC family protein n=1 Tax=Nitrincola alkalilacustris TaxID=1571224 RepID=UPI00197ECD9D|nr:WbqC family protein [Nitrincola alkalilacustris]
MTLGIMQPYFFPYLGHFALIAACERWVVFDISQYTRKSWMNRNRILHPKQGWQYISVPVANATLGIDTSEVVVQDLVASRAALLGKLSHYSRAAPYYKDVIALVQECFAAVSDNRLVTLNTQALKAVTTYLGIPFNYELCSELELKFPPQMRPGDWALEISRQYGASAYINPASGRELFDPAAFSLSSVRLGFSEFTPFVYPTGNFCYEHGMSILDVMMWCPPEVIKRAVSTHHKINYA